MSAIATLPEPKRLGSLLARLDRASADQRKTEEGSIIEQRDSNASTHPPTEFPANSDNSRSRPRISNILRDLKRLNPLILKAPTQPKAKHIFASDMVSEDYIEAIRQDKNVVTLDVEDLLLNERYRDLVSILVEDLFSLEDRQWKRISFVDSVAPEEFITWRGHKHAVMGSMVDCFDHLERTAGSPLVEFRAMIEFQPGTSIKTFLDALRSVNHHSLVRSVEFFGALFNCDKSNITPKLDDCVDRKGVLNTSIRIEVICGLEDNSERFELLEMCLQKGREIVNKTMMMDGSSQHNRSPVSPTSNNSRRRPRSHRRPRAARGTANTDNNTLDSPLSRANRAGRRRGRQRVAAGSSPTSVSELYNNDIGTIEKKIATIIQTPIKLPLSDNDDGNQADRREELQRLDGALDLPTAFAGDFKEAIPGVRSPNNGGSPAQRRRATLSEKDRSKKKRKTPKRVSQTVDQTKRRNKLEEEKHQETKI